MRNYVAAAAIAVNATEGAVVGQLEMSKATRFRKVSAGRLGIRPFAGVKDVHAEGLGIEDRLALRLLAKGLPILERFPILRGFSPSLVEIPRVERRPRGGPGNVADVVDAEVDQPAIPIAGPAIVDRCVGI